jgi:CheY-like chemotaxis protein
MKKILIIEDEVSLRKGIAEILTFEGYEVKEADNGKDGVILALKYLPDLILCDIMMPEMDGREVVKQLNSNENTKFIPFIFMTALAEKSDFRLGMALGADDYISKPFLREDLLKAVEKRLEKSANIKKKNKDDLDDLRKRILTHVPHELLTPLNGIIGFSEFMAENAASMDAEEVIDLSNSIHESGERLLDVIKHYFIYIQLVSKKKSDYPKNELLHSNEIIKEISAEIGLNNSRLDDLCFKLQDLPCLMGEDEFAILIKELVENAFKFSSTGEKVTISSKSEDGFFELTVHNFGRIFPQNSMEKIGAFIQFDRNIYEQQGSGLGLIICKIILDNFDCLLIIDSNINDGTTITIKFPEK